MFAHACLSREQDRPQRSSMSPPPSGNAKPLPIWATFVSSAIAACTGEVSCSAVLIDKPRQHCPLNLVSFVADSNVTIGYRQGQAAAASQVRWRAKIQVKIILFKSANGHQAATKTFSKVLMLVQRSDWDSWNRCQRRGCLCTVERT